MFRGIVTILFHKFGGVMLIEGINDSTGELSSRDSLSKKNINFVVRSVPSLRKTEVSPHDHQKAGSAPHESCVAFEIPGLGVHEVLLKSSNNNSSDV